MNSLAMIPWKDALLVVTNDFQHDRLAFTLIDTNDTQVLAHKSVSYAKVDADDKHEHTLWDLLGVRL